MQFIDGQSLAAMVGQLREQLAVEGHLQADSKATDPDKTTDEALARQAEPSFRPATSGTTSSESLLRSGPPGRARAYFREAARLMLQAAEALDHAHQVGVIHRDVKPANLLVDGRGNLWVTDFGLARLQNDAGLTASGDLLGTIRYMSPEQAQPRRVPVDHRTDVYGLGVTLYELLTLQPAFPGDDRRELLRRIVSEEPRRPRRLNRAVPEDLEAIVLKAMEKSPADRYATAHDLADDLRRFLDDKPVRARRPSPLRVAAKWARRHAGVVATGALAAAAVLVVLSVALGMLAVKNSRLQEKDAQLQKTADLLQKSADLLRSEKDATDRALQLSRESARRLEAQQGQTQAALQRAKNNGGLALRALKEIMLLLPDEQIKRDSNWARKAETMLTQALNLYEGLAKSEKEDPDVRGELAWAFRQAGSIRGYLGHYEPALKAYLRGLDLSEGLVRQFPDQWGFRFLLAGTYREIGDLHLGVGKRQEAVAAYQNSLEVWDRPTTQMACPLEASLAHGGLGDLQEAAGNCRKAEQHFRQAITHRQKLVAANPTLYEHRGYLAYWHRKLGGVLQKEGEPQEAEAHYRTALEAFDRLVRAHKDHVGYQLELAGCCVLRAALREEGDARTAEELYAKAAGVLVPMAQALPGMPGIRQLLGEVHSRIGTMKKLEGQTAQAAEHFRQARDLMQKLAAELPGGGPGPGAPGANENLLARFLASCPDEKFRDPKAAVELARKAVARAPDQGDYWTTLGAACYRAGDWSGAIEALERARKLHEAEGGDAADCFLLALAHARRGHHEQARAWQERALAWVARYKASGNELRLLREETAAVLGGTTPAALILPSHLPL
jgi:tetratricopeptide (TPR) repeat protein